MNNLVFLCGFPSSGTDLLKNVVNAHSEIFINGEFPLLYNLSTKYGAFVPAEATKEVVNDLKKIDIHKNFENSNVNFKQAKPEYSFAELYSLMLTSKKVRWKGNKTPQNTENIDKLISLFPSAKFILILRDVRDVALSWHKKWGKDKLFCACKWNYRMLQGYNALQTLENDRFLILKYEDLLINLENTAHSICDFLNIEYQEKMLEYYNYIDEKIDGKINYGKPIIKENTEKWRQQLTDKEVKRIEEVSFKSLTLFNYPVVKAQEYRPATKIEKYLGVVRDLYSLIAIGNRAREKNRIFYQIKSILLEVNKRVLFR